MTDIKFQTEIKDERDYSIRKGRILEKFQEMFHNHFKHNALYNHVLELLIRDADPYEIIERLVEINAEQQTKIRELVELIPPSKIIIPKP